MVAVSHLVLYDTLLQNASSCSLQNATVLLETEAVITKYVNSIIKLKNYKIIKLQYCATVITK